MGRLPFDLEIEDISALADIINEKKLGEIRLEDEDIGAKIVIKGRPCPPPHMAPMMPMAAPTAAPVQTAAAEAASEASAQESSDIQGNVVKSPIVGTYYSSPAPDKPPFVKVGQKVKKGDVLMIIESMKLMNEVQSEFDGEIKKIIVQNGQAVEYDQPIMIIG